MAKFYLYFVVKNAKLKFKDQKRVDERFERRKFKLNIPIHSHHIINMLHVFMGYRPYPTYRKIEHFEGINDVWKLNEDIVKLGKKAYIRYDQLVEVIDIHRKNRKFFNGYEIIKTNKEVMNNNRVVSQTFNMSYGELTLSGEYNWERFRLIVKSEDLFQRFIKI